MEHFELKPQTGLAKALTLANQEVTSPGSYKEKTSDTLVTGRRSMDGQKGPREVHNLISRSCEDVTFYSQKQLCRCD